MNRALALAGIVVFASLGGPSHAAGNGRSLPPGGHIVPIRGLRLYYEDHGDGRAVFLLHGGIGNGGQFSKQVPYLSPHFRLIVPDACAQGRTSDRPGLMSYHEMAEDVLALMNRLRIEKAAIVGWSDGGNVGLDLASHHPGRVSHLVTFGANFSPDGLQPADRAWGDTATAASFGPENEKSYRALAPDPSHYEVAMNKILEMWRTQPNLTRADLGRIRAKCLIVAGEHDVIRREHTEALANAIPGAKLWIVPGASHDVMITRSDEVNPRVKDFLQH